MEKTLAIIKPDAVIQGVVGEILKRIEDSGLQIVAMKMLHMSKSKAESFYEVHKNRPFFESLTNFMSSGSIVVMILKGHCAIVKYRKLIGATNFKDADEGTIRRDFATNIEQNVVHGSDSYDTAATEISFFFNAFETTE